MSEIIRIDLNGTNSYLAKSEHGFILFDTGGHLIMDQSFTDRRELLLKELDTNGCTQNNLNLIVLTHGDYDHSCNAAYLREHFNTKIAMHSGDKDLVENPTLQIYMDSYQYRIQELQQMFLQYQDIITTVSQSILDTFEKFTPDILLEDGFELTPYGLDATVIHTPGHTNGSIAVYIKNGDLICGDTFANNGRPGPAPNAIDFPKMDDSISQLKNLAIHTVYPGHGAPFTMEQFVL